MRWLPVALLGLSALTAAGQIINDVREAIDGKNFTRAERLIQAYRAKTGIDSQMIEALSWLARAELDVKQYDAADRDASSTRKLAVAELAKRKLDDDRYLPIALGASIEVHAQVLAARGERAEALAFLRRELAAYRSTSMASRIQKNINLLTLEGKPAPPLEMTEWLGARPVPLAHLKGHPVLLFFWAHWCGDCKADVPELARLLAQYRSRGLILIGPTQHYGYAAGGEEATRQQESRYIDEVRRQYYSPLGDMSVPVSEANFKNYGASTTPTLVLIDRSGIVRLYHPGAMSYLQLANKLAETDASRN
ncbi:MAG TPA: TlpA disulfide reductase family protein [Bryobacteraceae bacterium]|nr:TlpA disulfide reductase family protein [Bryobacteraceae bacterium]